MIMMKTNYAFGALIGFCLGSLYFMLPMFIEGFRTPEEPPKPKSNFEVVDTYKGCDVVRWTQSNLAEYKYFLDCRK